MEIEMAVQTFRTWLQQHPNEVADAHAGLSDLLNNSRVRAIPALPQLLALQALLALLDLAAAG